MLLSVPVTTSFSAFVFWTCVSAVAAWTAPVTNVQPENALLVRFTDENHILLAAGAVARTTRYNLSPIRAAEGLSLVAPASICFHVVHAEVVVFKDLYHMVLSDPRTTIEIRSLLVVSVGADGVKPPRLVQPEKALVVKFTDPKYMADAPTLSPLTAM